MTNAKIMIVEDEWIVAEDTQNRLQDLGYSVSSLASTGEEAIQKAEEDKPDLVVTDIVLEGEMDGIEVASGVYFVRLVSAGQVKTRKVVVIK